MSFISVYWSVHTSWLWLLWFHSWYWSQASHRTHQTTQVHWQHSETHRHKSKSHQWMVIVKALNKITIAYLFLKCDCLSYPICCERIYFKLIADTRSVFLQTWWKPGVASPWALIIIRFIEILLDLSFPFNVYNLNTLLFSKKYTIPEDWPYVEARRLFKEPEVTDPAEIDVSSRWTTWSTLVYKLITGSNHCIFQTNHSLLIHTRFYLSINRSQEGFI